ncbi:glyoxylase-like metal-dependent hydrolase (beta-lactamase superfamily II) [Spinactinospora alkalitolerans]|uniref:Glyoxylase-like metal-dependent hydrolase (Beta-lactamase superfamily II) n=1 Tax=Spinactinospora alkalitolerans TaxID=687207 RepID=A0A852TWU5_9ACTN|nr:MBL fold metallo-hydrolase [Spinactinospora alkalitolerans]NYE46534.1 glyoxylase-like metal-dependent hydrolase (beta-lactamase superfamily II) [Spinactinospora alkalitolerans]
MLIAAFPAGPLAANCYVVAAATGAECVIIDPGQGAAEGMEKLLAEHDLTPAAVLLTHGHFDHVWSAAQVSEAHGVPSYLHPGDRALLTDPAAGLDPGLAAQLSGLLGDEPMREPAEVLEAADGAVLALAGLEFAVDHAPGHTPGSVAYALPAGEEHPEVLFTGDLLFAGSIGRTDFPGGDHPTILRSLERVCLRRSDDTTVLPGHGPQTTIGRERATNPFLRGITES